MPQGVKMSEEVNTALKMEFLRLWDLGKRGRQLSATNILNGISRSNPEWSDILPTEQTVTRETRTIRNRLEQLEIEGEGFLDIPWSLGTLFHQNIDLQDESQNADGEQTDVASSITSLKDSVQKFHTQMNVENGWMPKSMENNEVFRALLEIQKSLIIGPSSELGADSTYWESEVPPRITNRQAQWFGFLYSIYLNVERSKKSSAGYIKIGYSHIWKLAKNYSQRTRLSSILNEPIDTIDLDVSWAIDDKFSDDMNLVLAENNNHEISYMFEDLGLTPDVPILFPETRPIQMAHVFFNNPVVMDYLKMNVAFETSLELIPSDLEEFKGFQKAFGKSSVFSLMHLIDMFNHAVATEGHPLHQDLVFHIGDIDPFFEEDTDAEDLPISYSQRPKFLGKGVIHPADDWPSSIRRMKGYYLYVPNIDKPFNLKNSGFHTCGELSGERDIDDIHLLNLNIKRALTPQNGFGVSGYPLSKTSLQFAMSQVPGEQVVESNRRKTRDTTKKAFRFLEYAAKVGEHKLTCKEKACQQFRELLKLEVIKDES